MPRYCDCRDKVRVVALLDVDSFEVQVRGKNAGISSDELQTEPYAVCALVISVNQPAKDFGIERGPNVDPKALRKVNVLPTPQIYGKRENLTTRIAGDDIYDCIQFKLDNKAGRKCPTCNRPMLAPIIEKSNSDEFILDLTNEVHFLLGNYRMDLEYSVLSKGKRTFKFVLPNRTIDKGDEDLLYYFRNNRSYDVDEAFALLQGGKIVADILDHVFETLGYIISAGLGENKLMAKLACHLSKPNGLAILPSMSMRRVEREISYTKIPGLGGTTGAKIKEIWPGIETIADFRRNFFRLNLGRWLGSNCDPDIIFERLNGIDYTPVVHKNLMEKITCGKTLNTNMKNQAITKADFIFHLYNRFQEMRDHLLYEYDRYCGRSPNHLKLEIFQHYPSNAGRQVVFRHFLDFPHFMMIQFDNWKHCLPFSDDDELREWKPLLGQFKSEINKSSTVPLFRNDGYFIRSIVRINLVAYF